MNLEWTLKPFAELTPFEVYNILQLRNEVFVVEQNCVFQDADDKDQGCWHLMAKQDNVLKAYTRIVPPGHIYNIASIGRVVTSPSVRGTGTGRVLMERSVEAVYTLFGSGPIKIGAQLYLKEFYSSLGFEQVSEVYLEDDIEHIHMIREAHT